MLRFKRPGEPKEFAKAMSPAARAAQRAIAAGRAPEFPDLWGRYRAKFVAAQHDKCGYCETFSLNHPAAVEHFAPKRAVHVLLSEGTEANHLSNVSNRETREISATGYYWLAYDWKNWLFACERCNSAWKRSLFPVREDPHPCPPRPRGKYTPLLLNPFGTRDPVEHLDFSSLGEISPRNGSAFGEATIRTCGLHRESLRRARQGIAADACRQIERMEKALATNDFDVARSAAEDLLSLGASERTHAGMVRSIILSKLKLSWRDLVQLRGRLAR
jgi:hypothetical protein